MTDHLFDNFVREKLADHSSPVPGGLWDKIEAATAEKSRKKGLARIPAAYRVAALLILCAGASALLFWPGQQNDTQKEDQATIVPSGEQRQQALPPAFTDSSALWHQGQTATTDNIAGTEANSNGSKDKEQGQVIADKATEKQAEGAIAASGFNTKPSGGREFNRGRFNNKLYLSNQQKADRNLNTLDKAAPDAGLSQGDNADKHRAADDNNEALAAFSLLPAEMISLKTLSTSGTSNLRQLLDSKGTMLPVIRCPVIRNSIPTDMYVEVYGSPVVPFKQTSANYGGADYLTRKDSSQQLRTSFSAGVRLSKGLTENLFLKAGVEYTQINEHFNYRQENERKQITVITEHTINRPQGDTILRDTSTYEQIGYLQKRVHNRYKSIDVPVLLSYEWGGDQWRLAATAGVIVNLQSWYTGEMLDTSFQAVSVKNSNNEVYKRNIGLGLYAGFSFIKPVSERMDLFASPYFRYNLSNMTRPGQSFNQRLHTAGLSLGIRYRLNGGQRF